MDRRNEVRDFLVSRGAKVTPDQVGLPAGHNRRVPGLRRSEVAALAGLRVEYYAKIERGAIDGASEQVLDAIGRARQLDDAEREHLTLLARTADGATAVRRRPRRSPLESTTRPSLQWALDAVTAGPAFVRNGRMDVVAANRLARAFYCDMYADDRRPVHVPPPGGRAVLPRLGLCRRHLRRHPAHRSGRNPHDRLLHDLVGELSTRSDDFRTRWGSHNVRHHGSGTKRFHHSVVGELILAYEGLEMAAEPGLTLTIYTAEPGSPSDERLRLLGSWAASQQAEEAVRNGSDEVTTEDAPWHESS